jgi:hypothetical protein
MAIDDLLAQSSSPKYGPGGRRIGSAFPDDAEVRQRVQQLRAAGRLPTGQVSGAQAIASGVDDATTAAKGAAAQEGQSALSAGNATTRAAASEGESALGRIGGTLSSKVPFGTVSRLAATYAPLISSAGSMVKNIADPQRIAQASDATGNAPYDVMVATGNSLLSGATLGALSPQDVNKITSALRNPPGVELTPGAQAQAQRLTAAGINPQSLKTDQDFQRARQVLSSGGTQPSAPGASASSDTASNTAANGGTIFRAGNTFSDQPIAGGVEFQPRGNLTVIPGAADTYNRVQQYLNQAEAERQQALARRDAGIDANIAAARQIGAQHDLEEMAREQRIAANMSNNPRTQRLLLEQAYSTGLQAKQLAAKPLPTATRTPEQEAQLSEDQLRRQAGELDVQGRQMDLAQRQRLAQLSQIIGTGENPRQAAIDEALVAQGKDPNAGRYQAIDVVIGQDMLGNPVKARGLVDTRTGRIIGAGQDTSPVGTQGQRPANFQEFLQRFRQDPRAAAYSDDQIKALYEQRYGGQ